MNEIVEFLRANADNPTAVWEASEHILESVLIPDYNYDHPETYPGGILPGRYSARDLLQDHVDDPEAVRFIADMLEE